MKTSNIITIVLLVAFVAFLLGRNMYITSNLTNGAVAPTFEAKNISGKTIKSEDFLGSYLMIDFWGSWCGPCRQSNPILRDLVHKYQDAEFKDAKSFEIVSVAIETSEAKWKAAIEKDKLDWENHISTLQRFDDPIAAAFDIKSIPNYVLIGPKGKVILVNVGLNDIDAFLGKKQK